MTASGMSLLGVNVSGGEYGNRSGTYGYDYIYPSSQEIDYYSLKGVNVIRVPLLWERLQPTLNGPLDPAELHRLDDVVSYAASKNMTVILDPHDYGAYDGQLIGTSAVPDSAFANFWGKLSAHFVGDENVMFGLMNEPNQQSATSWLASENAAIAAIRATGATQEILVPGSYWDGAWTWTTTDNAAVIGTGIVDPDNNYAFEVHQYLDTWSSGTEPTVVSAMTGVERLTAITNWAEQTHARLFLGEFGVGQDATSLAAMQDMLSYMSHHADVWQGGTYWAGGQWLGNYMYSIEPNADGTDKPQMDVLDEFTPRAGAASTSTDVISNYDQVASEASTSTGAAATTGVYQTDGAIGSNWSVAGVGNLTGVAGTGDVVWTLNGTVSVWHLSGGQLASSAVSDGRMGIEWAPAGLGDFNADGRSDILWVNGAGSASVWTMNGPSVSGAGQVQGQMGSEWQVKAIADVTGDGKADAIWVDPHNQVDVWEMSGSTLEAAPLSDGHMGTEWSLMGAGDLNGDTKSDLVWERSDGALAIWFMSGAHVSSVATLAGMTDGSHVAAVKDFNKDGFADLLWENGAGQSSIWLMQGAAVTAVNILSATPGTPYAFAGAHDVASKGIPALLYAGNGHVTVQNWTPS